MSDEKYFENQDNQKKEESTDKVEYVNQSNSDSINFGEKTIEENPYDTKKFIIDDKYREDEVNSYAKYSDYDKDFGERSQERINNQKSYDRMDGEREKDADAYFENAEASYYRDNLSSDDVRKITKDEIKKNKSGFFTRFITSMAGGLLGAAILIYLVPNFMPKEMKRFETDANKTVQTININQNEDTNTETAVYAKASPAVVGVTTQVETPSTFFSQGGIAKGVGSGVVISKDGYILTNSHVVSDGKASNIQVVFKDKTSVEAKLLWAEPEMDLAVLKVEKTDLTPIEIGDSSNLKVGEKTIAIGNPLGLDLQSTMTSGYISGLDRSITMQSGVTMDGLIQTDAAINSGNSGGALLNAKGQLIGINTAKASAGEGLGFAIPINTAKAIVDRVQKTGDFKAVVMGIKSVNVDYFMQVTGKDLNVEKGIYIAEVVEGSAADQAGLKAGDIITAMDGEEIPNMAKLKTKLLGYTIGDSVKITIQRDNVQKDITLKFSGELS